MDEMRSVPILFVVFFMLLGATACSMLADTDELQARREEEIDRE